ncbi:hypothetical protein [Streptomyces sp. V1I1]|uniref:hypothetical protein n=1 Tax=Streptomyces sp. V1I1 TaxID=3042272 RepID=UPI00278B105B|nr:hypothetical protein [Streptomyces sp. V1I1]MDQ0938916.1 hypothetical protein [Streptomyces sp. V1I1]
MGRLEPAPEPGEFGPAPKEDGDDDESGRRSGKGGKRGRSEQRRDTVTSARQALEAIQKLTNA